MRRGLEAGHPELYVFSIDATLSYQLTPEERGFSKALNLEDIITSYSWELLHPQLVKEAITSFEPTTLLTTMKGKNMAIIAKN